MARVLAIRVAVLLAMVAHCQAQGADTGLWRSVEACQKVVKKHITLAESTVTSTMNQLAETLSVMESYVKKWGDLVVAGAPESAAGVRLCQRDYANATAAVARTLEGKLRQSLAQGVVWYDDQIFSLFTDVVSEEGQAGVVQSVKFHLEPAQKEFGSMAVSALKQSVKDSKPAYEVVSRCIRDVEAKPGAR